MKLELQASYRVLFFCNFDVIGTKHLKFNYIILSPDQYDLHIAGSNLNHRFKVNDLGSI